MRAILYGIPTAALAMVIAAKTVRAEVEIGQTFTTQAVCKSAALVEAQVRAVVDTGGKYDKANALYERDMQNGDCVSLPYAATVKVVEAGYVSPVIVDSDGDTIRMNVVRIEAPAPVWTVAFEIIKAAGKS